MSIVELATTEYASAEQAFADWSVMDDPETLKVAERAARRLAEQYADTRTIEYEDAFQEAVIILASKPQMVRECLTDPHLGYGVLATRLHQHLVMKVRTEASRRTRLTSFETNSAALSEAV
ncbi:hypothetical protein [Streptodolium elevatio]|uniref:Uncharacterized protein n=1 Tax=Streptodolium elevatio TaxID=3157996 RepID=A0ABV3DBT0_9ACTN